MADAKQRDAIYVARTIRAFLDDSGSDWDWDDFTSCSMRDPQLDDIRKRAAAVELPVDPEGCTILEGLAKEAEQLRFGVSGVSAPNAVAGMINRLLSILLVCLAAFIAWISAYSIYAAMAFGLGWLPGVPIMMVGLTFAFLFVVMARALWKP